MNINESKLAIYERNPERYCEEIKAMNQQMWSEWDAEYQKHEPFVTPGMTAEQFARKCQEKTRQTLLMNRVIILNGKVSRMEYRQWSDAHQQPYSCYPCYSRSHAKPFRFTPSATLKPSVHIPFHSHPLISTVNGWWQWGQMSAPCTNADG